ncbi:COX5B-domain-containing protein [Amniculicola lignicola CBS 123094]|uniref:Cytochrome c oxidase subunit 4, mitochondrial n=1 Tax=Amniculicola lignicola CBS 123094 TaxID=1392246 RepID=A0A6A5WMD3_9PLEO|nr:COX5B-domain-containing protein [Amniculicola lignicola CBS 123094]
MFLQRSALAVARRGVPRALAARTFTTSIVRREEKKAPTEPAKPSAFEVEHGYKKLEDIRSMDDLYGPGAKPGTIPTDIEQATGLERLEILGKVQGVDVFDMKPLDASRLGTPEDPIIVNSAGEEQYLGCTGFPADSHNVIWQTVSRKEPVTRCMECGSTYKMHYVGPADDAHGHEHHTSWGPGGPYEKPKNMADFIKPEYADA